MSKVLAFLSTFLFFSTKALFADGEAAPARQTNYMQTLIMLAVFVVIFYFVLLRPEQKRRKRLESQRGSIKTGDKVTAMGIIGTVAEVKETTLILKMIDGAKIECLKAAVTDVQSPGAEQAKA